MNVAVGVRIALPASWLNASETGFNSTAFTENVGLL